MIWKLSDLGFSFSHTLFFIYIYHRMLLDFYSASPEKQGRLHGEGHSSPLSIMSTLPAFLFSCGLMVPVFGTTLGRQYYWRTWIAGSLLCCFWMKFVTRWCFDSERRWRVELNVRCYQCIITEATVSCRIGFSLKLNLVPEWLSFVEIMNKFTLWLLSKDENNRG